MRISVAMATHDAEAYLEPLLESLARQTRQPAELVVHDDASSDGTVGTLEAFAARAPFPVRIERADSWRGHVAGFLRAAELCEGDAVAFCDADDVWIERKLEICADALERSHAMLALHTTRVVDTDLHEIAPPWPAIESTREVPRLGFTGPHLDAPGMAMVFRRSLLELADPAGRPPSRYGHGRQMVHDEWALFLASVAGPIWLIAEPLVLYRQHGGNDTGWFERERRVTLEPLVDDYRTAAEYTAACAEFLSEVAAHDSAHATLIREGARHYRRLADCWEWRLALYEAAGRVDRARLVGRLVAARAYRPRASGGFGPRALGKDLLAGVGLGAGRTT